MLIPKIMVHFRLFGFYTTFFILISCECRLYAWIHKYQNSNVVCMTRAARGSLSVRNTARRVAVPQTKKEKIDTWKNLLLWVRKSARRESSSQRYKERNDTWNAVTPSVG